jgi:hypothetical protein
MDTNEPFWKKTLTGIWGFFTEPLTLFALIISITICVFLVLEAVYPEFIKLTASKGIYWFQNNYPIFATTDDRKFSNSFVEWFGVFYGFLLPLLLVRAWEQLDRADREFDQEADAIKVLLEDVLLLDDEDFLTVKRNMVSELKRYVNHVLLKYDKEHIEKNEGMRKEGDNILQGIRSNYKELIYRGGGVKASRLEPLTTELLKRLNDAIDIRGDRIATFGERLFESLRIVALGTSLIWLVPFYFLDFQSGLFGSFLKLSVTFLIIIVLTVIYDLDDPFGGAWKVSKTPWVDLQSEIQRSLDDLEQQAPQTPTATSNKEHRSNPSPRKIKMGGPGIPQLLWAGGLSLLYFLLISPKRGK